MRNEGTRVAQIAAKHSPAVQVIAWSHLCVPWICVEQQIARFQHQLGQKKTLVHPSVGKKTQVWVRVNLG
jgi:hypothetical protein